MVGPDEYPAPGTGMASWPAPGQPPAPSAPATPAQVPPLAPGQPAYGQPAYPQQGQPFPAPPQQPLGRLGPVHKPGAVPLRPLKLGDVLDATVRIVRHNPGATVGASLLIAALAVALPLLVSAVWGVSANPRFLEMLASDDSTAYTATAGDVAAFLVVVGSWILGIMVQSLGSMLVTGVAAHVTRAAALGGKLSLAQAWAATAGQRLRLVGLAFLLTAIMSGSAALYASAWVLVVTYTGGLAIALWALVSLPLVVAASMWFWVRVYTLAVPALAVENLSVGRAMGRALHLSHGSFWRLFGISLVVMLIVQVAASVLSTPVVLLSVVPLFVGMSEGAAFFLSLAIQFGGTVLATALFMPFLSVSQSLLHLDMRMRREAYDVELITRSGATAP